jgi:type IV secretory pathway protease TraF
MGLGTILTIAIAVLVVGFAVNSATLWLCGRALRLPRATWRRSLATVLAIWAASVPLALLSYAVDSLPGLLVVLLASLVTPLWIIHRMIGTSVGKSCLVAVAWFAAGSASAWAIALLVAGFLLESCLVPTGALATTILGLHADVTCDNCGSNFPITMSEYSRMPVGGAPADKKDVICRNCGRQQVYQLQGKPESGDRILVDKTSLPTRWDLAVFWHPPRGKELPPKERAPGTPARERYVMRLVSLPGETLQLADGDVFVDGRRLQKLPGQQEDLWFPIYDSRHASKAPQRPAWKTRSQTDGWNADGQVSFEGESDEMEEILFARPIDTHLAYNASSSYHPLADVHVTGDVRITCTLADFSGSGGFGFSWVYRGLTARATVAASGDTSLTIAGGTAADDNQIQIHAPTALMAGQRWAFAYRDGRAYVEQDGRVVASRRVGSDRIEDAPAESPGGSRNPSLPPDDTSSACHIGLLAKCCRLRFSEVRIDRDVYYVPPDAAGFGAQADLPIHLGEQEYFMLGDNSAFSYDSRFWGAVEEADFVGVVRVIFWPPSRWRAFP